MLILSRVCVEFRNHGIPVFQVNPADRMTLLTAPDSIRADPIFDLLVADGSLEVVDSRTRSKELELDPVQDTDVTGKRKNTPKTVKADKSAPVPASDGTAGGADPEAAPAADAAPEASAKSAK